MIFFSPRDPNWIIFEDVRLRNVPHVTVWSVDGETKVCNTLYVREEYECKRIKIPNAPESPETLWVEVLVNHTKIAIGTLYKAPNIPCTTFHDVYDSLVYIFSKYDDPILTGDFNVNMLNPESSDYKHLSDSLIEPFDLKQIINKPT